ncbi:transglycosylase domain-containing protein [Mariniluteicoccus endophyticus]
MAKSSARAGTLLYRLLMFVVVSVFAGVLVAGLFIPFAGMAGAATKSVASSLENLPADLEIPRQSERSVVKMANGEELARFWDENRVYVGLNDIAPIMRQAQVAIEDHRFYEHGALDTKATLRALVRNSSSSSGTQGGSSLTQQYVKMVRVETAHIAGDDGQKQAAQARSVTRKIEELRYAIALEKKFSKDEILERYLNIAYYGYGSYGVEAAAQKYFSTSAKDLSLDQAALLAGLVQNPAQTDPVNYERIALERRKVVLGRMAQLQIISEDDAKKAAATPFDRSRIRPTVNGCVGTRYPFLCDYVSRSLRKMPALGATPAERENTLKRGGLTIETEIDPRTQDAAENAINRVLNPEDPVISTMTMIQPGTGLILGMAQNRPKMGNNLAAGETYYNYAVGGSMSDDDMGGAEGYQAGSTFKAFTAAAALAQGIPLSKTYDAAASMNFTGRTFKNCQGKFKQYGDWTVKNSTGTNGVMDMYRAAAYSVNTYFVQLIADVGGCETTKMAKDLGVKLGSRGDIVEEFNSIPAFTLGSAEVTPLSVTEAYATFAARGKHCDPIIIKKVTAKDGRDVPTPSANCRQVMDAKVADGMNSLLSRVMSGTGARATIPGGYPQAGKTGTTDSNQAIWFAGYTPQVAGTAMIAIDKTHPYWKSKDWFNKRGTGAKPTLKGVTLPSSRYSLEGSGGGDAGQDIYKPAMAAALQGKPKTRFEEIGREVTEGKPVAIPSIKGMTMEQAKATLQDAGFSVITSRVSNSARPGTWIGTTPSGGTAPKGSTITFLISSGPAPKAEPKSEPSKAPAPSAPAPAPSAPAPAPAPAPPATAPPAPAQPAPAQPAQPSGQASRKP